MPKMECENNTICRYMHLRENYSLILLQINSQTTFTKRATQRYLPENALGLYCTSIMLPSLYIFL